MRKRRIERNLPFPREEFRTKVRTAAKDRGFRTEQAFILAACENELKRDGHTDANSQMEARLIASMQKIAKEFQALYTLVHVQFALTNSLLQYVLTCTIEPPEEALPAARAGEAQICKDPPPRGTRGRNAEQSDSGGVLNGGKQT